MDVVSLDHSYTKHHASLSSVPKCPTRYLYMERPQRQAEGEIESNVENEIIDVCDAELPGVPLKTSHNTSMVVNIGDVIWEESLASESWSSDQLSFFEDVILVLKSYQLSVGTISDKNGSSFKRHLALSKASLRLLRLLCSNNYNRDLFLWMNSLLKQSPDYSCSWFDVISQLNAKYRGLFEKMQVLSHIGPLLPKAAFDRPKLPHLSFLNGIVIIVMPPRPHWFSDSRYKAFIWYLSKFFQVKSVKPSHRASHSSTGLSLRRWLRNLVIEARNVVKKAQTLATPSPSDIGDGAASKTTGNSQNVPPKSRIVLLGWGASAMVACQLAASFEFEESENPLSAVVCLCPTVCSFAHGLRGHSQDPLAMEKVRTPLMFITGQLARASNVDDIEDFRDRLPNDVKSRLIVIGGANDRLSISSAKQLSSGLSQGDVDVSIVEEIYSFISFVVTGVLNEIGPKVDANESQQQTKPEGASSTKRSVNSTNRGGGTRASKASRQSASQPTTSQLFSTMASAPHHRGHLPITLLEPSVPVAASAVHSQTASLQNSDQVEVTCHDYAASSLPVNAIALGSPSVTLPVYNSSGSEQSLRYMLSAGAVAVCEAAVKRGPSTISTGQRCPAPVVYRKKVAAPVIVSGANLSATILEPSRAASAFIHQPSPSGTATTVSIVNVNNPASNVFVLSSHVKEQ